MEITILGMKRKLYNNRNTQYKQTGYSITPGSELLYPFRVVSGWKKGKTMDNWQYRSDNMKCKTCMWFREKLQNTYAAASAEQKLTPPKHIGRCRKNSPTLEGWPVIFGADWCGDHKLDENKA